MADQHRRRPSPPARTHHRRPGTTLAVAVAGLVLVGACSSGDGSPGADGGAEGTRPPGPWPAASLASALEPYDSCDALADDLTEVALDHVGPYGYEGFGGDGLRTLDGDVVFEEVGAAIGGADAPASAPPTTVTASRDAGGGDGATSDTNVQVAGVDEPDVVKLDGDRLYSAADGRLLVIDLAGDQPTLLGATDLPAGDGHQLLVDGDRVLAMASSWGGPIPADEVGMSADEARSIAPGSPTVELAVVDVSDPGDPTVVEQQSVDGSLLGARMVDGTARLVTTAQPTGLATVYPSGPGAEEAAEAANRAILEATTAEDWLPQVRTVDDDGDVVAAEPAVGCEAVSHPGVWSGTGTISVLTVDVDAGALDPSATVAVQATGQTIYADADTLYVATYEHLTDDLADDPQQADPGDVVTSIHAFDISGTGPATYLATGEVEGHLLDQFAMDEHDGVLRVATTTDAGAGGDSESHVTTLARRDGELVQLGRVGDMGRTEQIRSVRFLGDVGYVVTFRQTDPLYTVDLSDPAAPTVVGELKIPGFSSYLHPIGDGRLLGIGQDATDDGGVLGTQVSLFDVSDPASPVRLQTWSVPDASSMAEGDHHAFLWWAPDDLLVIPLSTYGDVLLEGGFLPAFDGAVALDVADGGITERGRVQHLVDDPYAVPFDCPPGALCEPPVTIEPQQLDRDCGTEEDCALIGPVPQPPTTTTICGVAGCDPVPTTAVCDPAQGCSVPGAPTPGPSASPVPIQRTLVVDGRLVTVSWAGVMVSTLAGLDQLGWLATEG